MKKIRNIILINLIALTLTWAVEEIGGTAGTFLNYGASPRTLALGKAFTGLANALPRARVRAKPSPDWRMMSRRFISIRAVWRNFGLRISN